MDKDFWLQCWENNDIGFHQKNINPRLCAYWDLVASDSKPVFVPLCGKSLDMTYFAKRGHQVIGVELSESAVKEFFSELDLKPQVRNEGSFQVYEAGSYQIFCGDIFELNIDFTGVSYVYDRASLIALKQQMRQDYCKWLLKNLPHAKILLLTIEFDDGQAGPPFSIPLEELQARLSDGFTMECLIEESIDNTKVPHKQIQYLIERVHKLSPKS